ncbi:hypothetical protein HOD75_02360 [archaeon]|nr:hypothetical protein [archaeon]MBT4241721.1 hypothetical protein [archaeon]MBT4418269.1 hypothetical protein [archaeon]
MAVEILAGINFFMPIISFLFVFAVIYAILLKTEILGSGFNLMIALVMAAIFTSFSSLELYVRTIVPWFIVMLIIVFLVLLIAGFSTKSIDKIMTPAFARGVVVLLIIVFMISAIYVFNPSFHPDLVLVSGEGPGIVSQLKDFFSSSKVGGSLLLIITVVVVSMIITKKSS